MCWVPALPDWILPSQDMGVGLAVVPLMGLLETIAIAKAFGRAVPGSCPVLTGGSLQGLRVLGRGLSKASGF